jgi:Tfp pilus assembly protein PilO
MSKLNFDLREVGKRLRLSAVEWIALAATLIFAGFVTFNYLNSTQPLRSKLSDLRAREKKLQAEMKDEAAKRKALEDQRANAEKILDSLSSFEARLHPRKTGITAIIDEVNHLAKTNRVRAGDISFRTDAPEQLAGEAKPGASPGTSPTPVPITRRDKMPNVYEGLGIDTTVEGDYHDLRRFLAALERSRNFVIINAIALQSVDEKERSKFKLGNPDAPLNPGAANPNAGGMNPGQDQAPGAPTQIVVSLKVELETHFAREEKLEAGSKLTPANAPAPRQ